MYLARYETAAGPRWAVDGKVLPASVTLSLLLELPRADLARVLEAMPREQPGAGASVGAAAGTSQGRLLPPVEAEHEVWAAGVTYLRSREAREAESSVKDVYTRVYEAERPELFFKAVGWRVVGAGAPIRIRRDSRWNVPEPELALVINAGGEIVGYAIGNDVSSRDIEGENPLYLPQAKVYDGSCALGPGIVLCEPAGLRDLAIQMVVQRGDRTVFQGETRTSQLKRTPEELVGYLRKELSFPRGVFLLTGTGIIPPGEFSLERGDLVRITIGQMTLENRVAAD